MRKWFFQGKFSSKLSFYILLAVAILVAAAYFVPLWKISISGSQFPDPLIMKIWVNKITGGAKGDLYTINDFNHYIGMKKIHQDSIPELRYMPFVLLYMLLGAIVSLFARRIFLIFLGIVNLCLVALVGFYDYWRWLHDYGTDLDTRAPLYSPDVDFQPPLLACKDILNVTTCSSPHFGTCMLLLCGILLSFLIYHEYSKRKESLI